MMPCISSEEICAFLRVPPTGSGREITRVGGFRTADSHALVFAASIKSAALALQSPAGMILAPLEAGQDVRLVGVANPRQAFTLVYQRWFRLGGEPGIHAKAIVESGARLGAGCCVEAGAYLAGGVELGEQCWIGPNAVLQAGTRLGRRVRVQAGAILGSEGFGYVSSPEGYVQFPQVGRLEIGDDVEIGAGTTIDRGALDTTTIGRGTKIDNLVHIAHNCRIGEDVLIAAQAGIAGSSVLEDRVVVGGQVGIAEHVYIGPEVVLGAQAGVPSHKRLEGMRQVFWGTPARPIQQILRDLARLRRGH